MNGTKDVHRHRRAKSLPQSIRYTTTDDKSSTNRIQVYVRIKPLDESDSNAAQRISTSNTSLRIPLTSTGLMECSFDRIFDGNISQTQVYASMKPLVTTVMEGCSSTVFVYGQTGTGKTFTMLGMDDNDPASDENILPESFGIIPRTLHDYMSVQGKLDHFTCAYIEVYNDKIYDLILDKRRQRPLSLREGSDGSLEVHGLSFHSMSTTADLNNFLKRGRQNRAVRETEANAQSSRSHVILQVSFKFKPSGRKVRLNLVDLAGSEKWSKQSQTRPNSEIEEMKHIDSSLSALGNCIAALSQSGRKHIPYRDSTLTRLLQDTLRGQTRTILIATIHGIATEETIRTVQFADRMRSVMQCSVVKPMEKESSTQLLQSELAMTRAKVAELADQLQTLALVQEKQANLSKHTIHALTCAVEQKLLNEDRQFQKLEAQLGAIIDKKSQSTPAFNSHEVSTCTRLLAEESPMHQEGIELKGLIQTKSPWHEFLVSLVYIALLGLLTSSGACFSHDKLLHKGILIHFWSLLVMFMVLFLWLLSSAMLFSRRYLVPSSTFFTCAIYLILAGVWYSSALVTQQREKVVMLVLFSLLTCATTIHYFYRQKHLRFASAHVAIVQRVLWSRPSAIVALVFVLCCIVGMIIFASCLAACALVTTIDISAKSTALFICLGNVLYLWTLVIFRYVIFGVAASLLNMWWSYKRHPEFATIFQALFNLPVISICFGSICTILVLPIALCVAPVVWLLLSNSRRRVPSFWHGGFQSYTFTLLTTEPEHGGYLAANRRVQHLFGHADWMNIASGNLLSITIPNQAISTGLLLGTFAYHMSEGKDILTEYRMILSGGGFLMGFTSTIMAMSVVQASIAACMIFFVNDPFFLAKCHPSDHNQLHLVWNEIYAEELAQNQQYIKPDMVV